MDDSERILLYQLSESTKRHAQLITELRQGNERNWKRYDELEERERLRDVIVEHTTEVLSELKDAMREQTGVLHELNKRIASHELIEARSWVRALLIQLGQFAAIAVLVIGFVASLVAPGFHVWLREAIHRWTQ